MVTLFRFTTLVLVVLVNVCVMSAQRSEEECYKLRCYYLYPHSSKYDPQCIKDGCSLQGAKQLADTVRAASRHPNYPGCEANNCWPQTRVPHSINGELTAQYYLCHKNGCYGRQAVIDGKHP